MCFCQCIFLTVDKILFRHSFSIGKKDIETDVAKYFFEIPFLARLGCLTWTGFWVKKVGVGNNETQKEKHQEKKQRCGHSNRRVFKLSFSDDQRSAHVAPIRSRAPLSGESRISQVVHRGGVSVPRSSPGISACRSVRRGASFSVRSWAPTLVISCLSAAGPIKNRDQEGRVPWRSRGRRGRTHKGVGPEIAVRLPVGGGEGVSPDLWSGFCCLFIVFDHVSPTRESHPRLFFDWEKSKKKTVRNPEKEIEWFLIFLFVFHFFILLHSPLPSCKFRIWTLPLPTFTHTHTLHSLHFPLAMCSREGILKKEEKKELIMHFLVRWVDEKITLNSWRGGTEINYDDNHNFLGFNHQLNLI